MPPSLAKMKWALLLIELVRIEAELLSTRVSTLKEEL
jgi:hypothetical protein